MKTYTSYRDTLAALKNKETTCYQIVQNYIQTISKKNKQINAFIEVYSKEALSKASQIDKKISNGTAGKLAGMVVGIKDNICYKNHKISASSKMLKGFKSLYSATVVERLIQEDAIIIGKLNCDEFAMGSSTETSVYGVVRNPININKSCIFQRISSAVASQMCLVALGSDTGGSIRQPAAFCGVVGLKPTYSRVSRYGLIAYASSFDQIGPITNNVEDSALVLEVISGKDNNDATSSSRKADEYSNFEIKKKRKIAVISECLERNDLDDEVKKSIKQTIENLKKQGHELEYISFPLLDFLVPTYYVLTTERKSSNLLGMTGFILGIELESKIFRTDLCASRSEGFGEEVKDVLCWEHLY